jgi:hypothetical protein
MKKTKNPINIVAEDKTVPVLILCVIMLALWLIPFKVLGAGFMPNDDSLRHAAKAVSGKSWDQILVLRDGIKFDTPEKAAWAPGKDGIVYSNQMAVFYTTFYKYPDAPWRYAIGFEPGLATPDNLAVYRNAQIDTGFGAYKPWLAKMKREDRLVIYNGADRKTAGKIARLVQYRARRLDRQESRLTKPFRHCNLLGYVYGRKA